VARDHGVKRTVMDAGVGARGAAFNDVARDVRGDLGLERRLLRLLPSRLLGLLPGSLLESLRALTPTLAPTRFRRVGPHERLRHRDSRAAGRARVACAVAGVTGEMVMTTLCDVMAMGNVMRGRRFVMMLGRESRLSDSSHRECEYAGTHGVLQIIVEPAQSRFAL
jgi:hypothetical protein